MVTCIVVVYPHALTRGKAYEVAQVRGENYRIIGDHGKRINIHRSFFLEGMVSVPHVVECRLDRSDERPMIELDIRFSDDSWCWCLVSTPEMIVQYFADQHEMEPPGFNIKHLIIVRDIKQDTIESMIKHLESRNELSEATLSGSNPDDSPLAA